jgi:glucose/arabinose dehydrogenase
MQTHNRLRLFLAFTVTLIASDIARSGAVLERVTVDLEVGGKTHAVEVPSGSRLELLTEALQSPRMLTFAPDGDLFIGSNAGRVYRLRPPYRKAEVFANPGGYPHSVVFRTGELLIAYTEGLYSTPYEPGRGPLRRGEQRLLAALPAGGGGHRSRTVRVGPDGRIYLSLGISGNCSNEYLGEDYPFQDRRGGVLVLDEDGPKPVWRPFAAGLRNPIGFDWHPDTGVLYASNNGPDHWGFELPPEYFSRLAPGSFHGMPWYQFDGKNLRRDNCIRAQPPRPADRVERPVATFPARSAPMAVAFVPRGALSPDLEGDAIVALRGSWATRPHGRASGDPATRREPKLVRVRFEGGEARAIEDLITGFQRADGSRWARPVGVAIGPDGALYFTSDSGANALFRLTRSKSRPGG